MPSQQESYILPQPKPVPEKLHRQSSAELECYFNTQNKQKISDWKCYHTDVSVLVSRVRATDTGNDATKCAPWAKACVQETIGVRVPGLAPSAPNRSTQPQCWCSLPGWTILAQVSSSPSRLSLRDPGVCSTSGPSWFGPLALCPSGPSKVNFLTPTSNFRQQRQIFHGSQRSTYRIVQAIPDANRPGVKKDMSVGVNCLRAVTAGSVGRLCSPCGRRGRWLCRARCPTC